RVDRQKALEYGVSYTDVANTLNTATNGTLSSYYQESGYQYPIYVQIPEAYRKSTDQILNLPIGAGASGGAASAGTASGGGATGSAAGTVAPATARYVRLGDVAQPIRALGPN